MNLGSMLAKLRNPQAVGAPRIYTFRELLSFREMVVNFFRGIYPPCFVGGSAPLGIPANDVDVFLLASNDEQFDYMLQRLASEGFHYKESQAEYGESVSCRRGDLNVILSQDSVNFEKLQVAQRTVAYLVNRGYMVDKEARKMIHRLITGEEYCSTSSVQLQEGT